MRRKIEDRISSLEFGEESCRYCFGKSAPDAPDMSGMIELSEYSAELGFATAMEQLQWSREQWGQQQDLIYSVLDVQMPIMMEQWEMSKESWANAQKDRARYEELYWPLEEDLIAEFENYASPERMELEAGRAGADVTRAFQAQRENAQRQLESYGIDPSQTRSQALDANMRAQEAAAQAGAENAARKQVEGEGRALRSEAINIGRGMPAQAAQQMAMAQQGGQGAAGIGNQAVGGYSGAYGTAAGAMGSPTQWMGAGQAGINSAMSGMNAQFNNQLASWNATQAHSPWGYGMAGLGFASQFMAEGGEVDGVGGPKDDAIPAKLSDGEFVIPAEVVERKGTEFFDKLIEKTRQHPAVQERYQQMHAQKALPPPGGSPGGLPMPQEMAAANGGAVHLADGGQPNQFKPVKTGPITPNTGIKTNFKSWVPEKGFATQQDMDVARQQYQQSKPQGGGSRLQSPVTQPQQSPAWDWRQGYMSDGSRWSDRLRNREQYQSPWDASEFMKSRKAYNQWEADMYKNTEPEHRTKAQEWMEANPGKTMEGTYDPNTWEYAVQQYQQRPERQSLYDLPVFSSIFERYGISPPKSRLKRL